MIPRTHPLASVGDAFNAVFVEAEAAGQLMFYGRGAGGAPDRQRGARRPGRGGPQPALRDPGAAASPPTRSLPVRPMGEVDHPLPHQPRRGGPAGRARHRRRGLRPARGVDRDGPPVRPRATTPRWSSSRTARPTPRWRRPSRSCAGWTSSGPSPACCGSRAGWLGATRGNTGSSAGLERGWSESGHRTPARIGAGRPA